MLKKQYGSSLRDWLGAASVVVFEGNKKIILCERSVSVHIHIDRRQDFHLDASNSSC